ncbi:MAG: NUDIX domain-containing protein [bacterium]
MMDREQVLASLCYVRENNHTLMLHRITKDNDIHEGKWNGLGGKFEPGETPEECVRREVQEEAGIKLEEETLEGVLTFPMFDGNRDWYVFVFTSESFSGEPVEESREGELHWIPNEELLDLNLWEGDRYFLRWLDEPDLFSGKFVYEDEALVDHDVEFYPI